MVGLGACPPLSPYLSATRYVNMLHLVCPDLFAPQTAPAPTLNPTAPEPSPAYPAAAVVVPGRPAMKYFIVPIRRRPAGIEQPIVPTPPPPLATAATTAAAAAAAGGGVAVPALVGDDPVVAEFWGRVAASAPIAQSLALVGPSPTSPCEHLALFSCFSFYLHVRRRRRSGAWSQARRSTAGSGMASVSPTDIPSSQTPPHPPRTLMPMG